MASCRKDVNLKRSLSDVEFVKAYDDMGPNDKTEFQTDEGGKMRIMIASTSQEDTQDGGHPSTTFIALDEDLKEVMNFKVIHDSFGGFFGRGGYSVLRWVNENTLFVMFRGCMPRSGDESSSDRIFVLDAKKRVISRLMCTKEDEKSHLIHANLIWNLGDKYLLLRRESASSVKSSQIYQVRLL